MKINFRGQTLELVKAAYADNIPALLLNDEDGMPYMKASVNVGELPTGMVAIKHYSENEGILEALIDQKIVSKPVDCIQSGYMMIPICKLLI